MENLTFESLPGAVSKLLEDVAHLKSLLTSQASKPAETDRWFDLDELCAYLPGNPARATIYGKVHTREIPHKKVGKRLAFLKSEIDQWLKNQGRKTAAEIEAEASQYLAKKKGGYHA
ncbi:helix-turn-helix transcriptional regulator [Adhaeribacter terreus]|uniref:Helix-turn-helix transcriptional regulator n=1 Tax=Adhaeribacter terreus TaxID=529703 RepID=A0ABW0EAY0_9BACT